MGQATDHPEKHATAAIQVKQDNLILYIRNLKWETGSSADSTLDWSLVQLGVGHHLVILSSPKDHRDSKFYSKFHSTLRSSDSDRAARQRSNP